jgi:GTP-sensing pleiotropic transcriptional regulator CodY
MLVAVVGALVAYRVAQRIGERRAVAVRMVAKVASATR